MTPLGIASSFAAFFLWAGTASAELRLPPLFSDHMVLQRGTEVPVWGTAAANAKVTLQFGRARVETTAGADGSWEARLPKLGADEEPNELVVKSEGETIRCADVLVGEVWICAGQSNMEFRLANDSGLTDAVARAGDPRLRYFQVENNVSSKRESTLAGQWVVSTPQSAPWFSAVAYYFGKDLAQHLNCPVGLIGIQWGATPAASWMSLEGLAEHPAFDYYVRKFELTKGMLMPAGESAENREARRKFDEWQAAAIRAKREGRQIPGRPAELDLASAALTGASRASADEKKLVPTSLFNGMVAPLIPCAMKGVIWYQGESNAGDNDEYYRIFPRLIADWRRNWKQGDFPFLFVQLPNFEARLNTWALVRDAQLHALRVSNTGMAVTLDLGDPSNIHPPRKQKVGERLARLARAVAYKEKIVPTGPLVSKVELEGSLIRIRFANSAGGLTSRGGPVPGELAGFEIAGKDLHWTDARARVEGEEVVAWSDAVTEPLAVRYAWSDNPAASLFNAEGLPASPFNTQTWNPNPPITTYETP